MCLKQNCFGRSMTAGSEGRFEEGYMSPLTVKRVTMEKDVDLPGFPAYRDEQGLATLIALIALSLFTVIALYMSLSAATETRISDNYESEVKAQYAARGGIGHVRGLLRGLKLNDLLQGPDGTYNSGTTYMSQARTFGFRNPVSWALARSLNLLDPTADVSGLPDDGLLNTGKVGATPGTVIIPQTGIAFTAPNPYGAGTITTARYFVKVTDNNGEASELAKDPTNNPFVDGDGIIIVRSLSVARTISETAGATVRRNSVAVYEARYQQSSPFGSLGSPVVVIGSNVNANFSGNAFDITGTSDGPGVATIDTNTGDSYHPDTILKAATGGKGNITGNCSPNKNCITDITAAVSADTIKAQLKDPVWLYNFVFNQVPLFADNIWNGSGPVDLGTTSNPKVTFVNGNLSLTGGVTGAGMLVVTGDLALGGTFTWDGLVIVVGTGSFWTHGMNRGIHGGMIVANLGLVGGVPTFGTPGFDIRGNSQISTYDSGLSAMGNGLVPLKELGIREVTSTMDP
jgi:hypothetical protein